MTDPTLGSVGGGCVEADVWAAAQDVLREEKSRVMHFDLTEESMAEGGLICGGKVEIFVEPVLPVPEMIIFGAGHISTQVSKIAVIAGFRTMIVDNRPAYMPIPNGSPSGSCLFRQLRRVVRSPHTH